MLGDIVYSGQYSGDVHLLKAELFSRHIVLARLFLVGFIPEGSTGAELGVFTGLFSSVLARQKKISKITFVDPWWLAFGDTYPDWGRYTDHGRVGTRQAYDLARRRIEQWILPNRAIAVATSYDWLADQPDGSLDWVYLDSTHTYDGTVSELALLDRKLGPKGIILGDDWQWRPEHRHHGVYMAVNEFCRESNFDFVLCGRSRQWIIKRSARASEADNRPS